MRKTTSFVSFLDIAQHIGLTQEEVDAVCDIGFSNVSWGDADYTLIGNNYALECILGGLLTYYDILNDNDGDLPSRAIPERTLTAQEVRTKFWEIVGKNDYVNMES